MCMLFVNQAHLLLSVYIKDFPISKSCLIALKTTIENQEFRHEFRDSIEILQQSVDLRPVLTVKWSNIKRVLLMLAT